MSASAVETRVAAANAVTLGASLAATGTIALAVRLMVPRLLGPSAFGELRLVESMAEIVFILLTFGIDIRLRSEAATNPGRVKSYLGGLVALRIGVGVAVIAVAAISLGLFGTTAATVRLFVVAAMAQVLLVLNNSYGALEHAAGDVGWLARTSLVFKVGWAVALVTVLLSAPTGLAIVAVAVVAEAARFGWLTRRGVRHHELRLRPRFGPAAVAVAASLPFFVNAVAHTIYGRIGVGWLAVVAGRAEVGLYAAAANLAAIALLGIPLLSWVLVPSAARAAAESTEALRSIVSGTLRASLLIAVPVSAVLWLTSEALLTVLFGPAYAPAAAAMRVIAPTVALTYASTVCGLALLQRGRVWLVAGISLAGVLLMAALNALLITSGVGAPGTGAGALAAAWALLFTEVAVTLVLAWASRELWSEVALVRTATALGVGAASMAVVAWVWPGTIGGAVTALGVLVTAVIALGGLDGADVEFARTVIASGRPTTAPRPAL